DHAMRFPSLPMSLLVTSGAAALAGAVACGEISDPTKEQVSKVSGALTGTNVPANAHVALVWRLAAGGYEVGADVAVVNGAFSIDLTTPPDAYFAPIEEETSLDGLSSGSTPSSGPSSSDTGNIPVPTSVADASVPSVDASTAAADAGRAEVDSGTPGNS